MNGNDDDRDLREMFTALRREEEAQVTGLRGLLESARTGRIRRSRTVFTPAFVAAAIVVALGTVIGQVLYLSKPAVPRGEELAPPLAKWTAPTAFLLRTPGYELLSSLPAFQGAEPALDHAATSRPPSAPLSNRRLEKRTP